MCLPGTKPENLKVTLSLRTSGTTVGLVATERLATRTLAWALVWVPSGLLAVALTVLIPVPGPKRLMANSGACAWIEMLPLASAGPLTAVTSDTPLRLTVVPATKPLPVTTMGVPSTGSVLTRHGLATVSVAAEAGAASAPATGTEQHAATAGPASRRGELI